MAIKKLPNNKPDGFAHMETEFNDRNRHIGYYCVRQDNKKSITEDKGSE